MADRAGVTKESLVARIESDATEGNSLGSEHQWAIRLALDWLDEHDLLDLADAESLLEIRRG